MQIATLAVRESVSVVTRVNVTNSDLILILYICKTFLFATKGFPTLFCNEGEKKRASKEMERSMKGYRELQKEVEEARKNMKEMEEMKYKKDKTIQTSFYKSPVGTR